MEYTKNIKVGDTVMFTSTSMQEACKVSSLSSTRYRDLINHPHGVACAKDGYSFLVEFKDIHTGHDGGGCTKPYKGLYISPYNLVVEHDNGLIVSLTKLL